MEASAGAGHSDEPREWQPRAIWVGGRLLCGSISFFFASFLFAYFYLKALDVNHSWKIGTVQPAHGLGITIMALVVVGAVIYRLAATRPEVDEAVAGAIAVLFTLAAVALQFFEYTVLGFGASSGGLRVGVLRLDRDVRSRRADGHLLDLDTDCEPPSDQARRPARD